MQSTSLIFGVLVVAGLMEVRIYGSVLGPLFNFGARADMTTDAVNAQVDHNFLDWITQVLIHHRPSTTTASPGPDKPDVCPTCKCGLTNTQRRIVGGVPTKHNQYPWMAQVVINERFVCGASVINSRYVLTAAHCIDRVDKDKVVIRIGDYDRSSLTETKIQDFTVANIKKHSGYSAANFNNDIAIIKLNRSINFDGSMRPVCLPEKGPTYAGRMGIVTGWGATEEYGVPFNILLEAHLPIMSNAECRSTKYPAKRITDNMMCAGYDDGGKDSCQGDSGGPLHVVDEDNRVHRLAGIVSWGEGCGLPRYPGVYTRVNRYLAWIKQYASDTCHCN